MCCKGIFGDFWFCFCIVGEELIFVCVWFIKDYDLIGFLFGKVKIVLFVIVIFGVGEFFGVIDFLF